MPSPLRILDPNADGRTLTDAQRALDAGDVDRARRILEELTVDVTTRVRAQAGLLLSGLFLMQGDASAAFALLARVPPALVVDAGARALLLASALRQLRRYADALVEAERAVDHGPSGNRLLVLADAQKHAGKLEDAIATLERLVTDDASHGTALMQLAGYLNLIGDTARADAAWARAEAQPMPPVEAALGRAFFFVTRADVDHALTALEEAFALDARVTRAYVDDEVELDPYRGHPRLAALLAGAAT